MLILSEDDVRQAVTMPEAIDACAAGFAQLSAGEAQVPLRAGVEVGKHEGVMLLMPAYLPASEGLGFKVVSPFKRNLERYNIPTIHAAVMIVESTTGRPLALMGGRFLTALRTGAGAGVATRYLARPDSRVLALFGAGAQARTQALAVCCERPIERIWIVNRTRERIALLMADLKAFGAPLPNDIRVADSAEQALAEADVVCCATAAVEPLFEDHMVRPGTHINAVGAFTPTMCEVPAATIARARVIVDQREGAWAESGELIQARDAGLIDEGHVAGEIGEVVGGKVAGRTDSAEVTFFKSVGNAVQDIAVGQIVVARAQERGLGVEVRL
jgi:ornithine cyclodeaminase/alanine dehydrogenase-like protein (mu-crystallin family)